MSRLNKTEVMVLGTLHGLHEGNTFYSYDDVFLIIERFNPDVIGIEIRKEDVIQTREYLEKYYPYEMIEAKFRYETNCRICGFDWFGKSIEGKPIPEKYFETLDIKILENEFDSSKEYIKEKEMIEVINKIRMPLVTNRTAKECNDGKYDIAVEILYNQLGIIYRDTPYEQIINFYMERDHQISNNMINIIGENKGERIMFLTGMDHRSFAIKAINSYFNDEIIFMDINSLN